MPWGPGDAQDHTKKADTPHLRALWAKIANHRLENGADDATAIKEANAAVDRARARSHRFI